MTSPGEKRRQDAARAKRYRQRKRLRAELAEEERQLADSCNTELGRDAADRHGLSHKADDDPTVRFAARRDEPFVDFSAPNFRGIAGLSERVESPYSAQARKAALAEERERLLEPVDYSNGSGYVPPAQRDRSRRERLLRRLTNAERRDATVREAKIRHMEAAEDGELESRNEIIDWSQVTEDGHLPEQPQEDLDPRSVRFVNPWNRRGYDRFEAESITLDLRK